ncbi:MAG TPA: 4-hydroxy-tetrahydrodipicolinate reductase [Candidatus Dormibacteraeota bacterium]|nr:4-hydroxy-tetrahydrodipicolinate reductase [Candidatus Dormibacteraeota bacterium]
MAGVTGWAGGPVARAIAAASDLDLVSGVSRSSAGRSLSETLDVESAGGAVFGSVEAALEAVRTDVLVDFTSAETVKENVITAVQRGVHVVNGSSGLTADDYAEIERLATEHRVCVVAMANASIIAALLQRFAVEAAAQLPSWEIIDYASATKIDVPSGTSRQLAERLGRVRPPAGPRPVDELIGPPEARGARIAGSQIHSLRLPSYSVSTEVIFAQAGERLMIRHEAGESPEPYVGGALLAIRSVVHRTGLVPSLDSLLFP